MQELKELQRQGMSIQAISELTGWDRKTIRKYVQAAGVAPEYGPRPVPPSKIDAFKPYLEERLRAGVWNARVLLRELRERNYAGGYTILTDWLRPQRSAAHVVAVRRFETPSGQAGASGLGASGHAGDGRAGTEAARLHLHAGVQPQDGGGSGARPDRRVHQLPGDRSRDLDVNYRALRLHHFSSSSIRPEGQPSEQRLPEPQVQHAHAAAALASGEQLPYALLR